MSLPRSMAQHLSASFQAWGKTPEDDFHDQNFINYWLQANQITVQELPVAMNWMAPQFEEATLREAKIVHFAGAAKSLIDRYAALLAKSVGEKRSLRGAAVAEEG